MFVAVLRMSESLKLAAETVTSMKTERITMDKMPMATTTSMRVKPERWHPVRATDVGA
jgi:hypothetical protein